MSAAETLDPSHRRRAITESAVHAPFGSTASELESAKSSSAQEDAGRPLVQVTSPMDLDDETPHAEQPQPFDTKITERPPPPFHTKTTERPRARTVAGPALVRDPPTSGTQTMRSGSENEQGAGAVSGSAISSTTEEYSRTSSRASLAPDSPARSRTGSRISVDSTTAAHLRVLGPHPDGSETETDSTSLTSVSTRSRAASVVGKIDCVPEKRVKEWQKRFKGRAQEDEAVVCTHGCALVVDIMLHGRLYITNRAIYFRSNIIGIVTKRIWQIDNLKRIEPQTVAGFISNAMILYFKDGSKAEFATLPDRNHVLQRLLSLWSDVDHESYSSFLGTNPQLPEGVLGTPSSDIEEPQEGQGNEAGDQDGPQPAGAGEGKHAPTEADCDELEKKALTTHFRTDPSSVYSLLYHNDSFLKSVWESQGMRDINLGGWQGKKRSATYTRPLGGSIGSTRCESEEEILHPAEQEDWYAVEGISRTPGVPSGKSFQTRSRTVFTWDDRGGTKMQCSFQVEWTGRSMMKGMINGQAEKGQIEWNKLLATRMRDYIQQHPDDFPEPDGMTAKQGKGGSKANGATDRDGGGRDGGQTDAVDEGDEDDDEGLNGDTDRGTSGPTGNPTLDVAIGWMQKDPIRAVMAVILCLIALSYLWKALKWPFTERMVTVPAKRYHRLLKCEEAMYHAVGAGGSHGFHKTARAVERVGKAVKAGAAGAGAAKSGQFDEL